MIWNNSSSGYSLRLNNAITQTSIILKRYLQVYIVVEERYTADVYVSKGKYHTYEKRSTDTSTIVNQIYVNIIPSFWMSSPVLKYIVFIPIYAIHDKYVQSHEAKCTDYVSI